MQAGRGHSLEAGVPRGVWEDGHWTGREKCESLRGEEKEELLFLWV